MPTDTSKTDQIIKAPKLHRGDTVAIFSPSNPVADRRDEVTRACAAFERATGLRTVLAPNALAADYYSAGTVDQRLSDFHWAIGQPDIKAVICMVGGQTAIELVDKLDYDLIRRNPKVIAGISDATMLLNPITARTGLVTFLGLEFLHYASQPMGYETLSIIASWFDGTVGEVQPNPDWQPFNGLPTSYEGWQSIRGGRTSGRLVGGNNVAVTALCPTDYMPSLDGAILAIETYRKSKKDIHQLLAQYRLWGVLDRINGLIMGYCMGSDDPAVQGDERSLRDTVRAATDGYDFPVMWIGEIGHNVENLMLPIGAMATLDADRLTFSIDEPVVAS